MATNDLYQASYQFESPSSGFTVGMSYRQASGTNDENTLTDLADELFLMHSDEFAAVMSNQVSLTGITTFQVTGDDETPGRVVLEQPNVGDVISEALPMGAAVVMSFLTDAPNSRFNGRMFVGGVPESFEVVGQLQIGAEIAYAALALVLDDDTIPLGPGAAVFTPVTISRILDGVPRVPPVGFDITAISFDSFIKNQRRRNTKFIGVGGTT